jgi:hypothetical protein
VIVGHDFLGASLDVLLHRMRELKADHWSRMGRFRRSKWPSIGKQGSNLKFLSGRMLCDLASDGAKVGFELVFLGAQYSSGLVHDFIHDLVVDGNV